jgi:hypothetical protein
MKPPHLYSIADSQNSTAGPADDVILTINNGTAQGDAVRGVIAVAASETVVHVRRRVSADGTPVSVHEFDEDSLRETTVEPDDDRSGVWIALEAVVQVEWAPVPRHVDFVF